MAKITSEVTRKVATLARLKLTEDEVAQFTVQLEAVMNYFKELDQLDCTGVEPITGPVDLVSSLREDRCEPFEDKPKEGALKITATSEDVLYDGYKVPPVL